MTGDAPPPKGLTPDEAEALAAASRHATAYRIAVTARPIPAAEDAAAAFARFDAPLPASGIPAPQVIDDLAANALPGLTQFTSPRFFGYVAGASHPVGVAADHLVSAWGQNAATSHVTPAVAAIERVMGTWALDLLGLPPDCGVGVVTGATVANTAGILAARHRLLARQGWDVERDGLFGAPAIPVLIGADAHSAPAAGLRLAGFGSGRVVAIDTDAQGRMRPEALATALAACASPPLVILQAGQINTGASDPFAELVPLVRAHHGWVHVDGAFGLWLAAAPGRAAQLAGVEQADSWATDLHKWLSAPYDAALAIVRDRADLTAALSLEGAYLPDRTAHWDPMDSVPELSRRARGVPAWAILRHLGRDGVAELVDRHCRLAERAAGALAATPQIAVMNEVVANQVIFRCGSDGVDGDALTARVLARIHRRGRVYPSHGEWRGRRVIRVSISGYATQAPDIDLLVEEVRAALADCAAT